MEVTKKLIGSHYDEQKSNTSGLIVIGAGLPRTGTSSMRMALSALLDGKCYHMADVFHGKEKDWNFWDRALDDLDRKEKSISDEEWVEFLSGGGYRAGVDYPISLFYRELMKAFPNAKVVLTVRDNPEGWYKSVKESIFRTVELNADFGASSFMKLVGGYRAAKLAETISWKVPKGFEKGMFGVVGSSVEESSEFYNRWNEEVKKVVPADRLLIFNVKQGWTPLCQFLELPVPEGPFPNFNDTKSFNKMIGRIKLCGIAVVYVLPIAIASLGFVFRNSIASYLPF